MIKSSILLGTALFTVLFSPLSEKELQQPLNGPTVQAKNLTIEDIVFLEDEEEIDLCFDTAAYLPINFNAYKGMELDLDLDEIPFIEEEEELVLVLDTNNYLPEGFDAYAKPEFNLADVTFIEEEEDIILGFYTDQYLPRGFKATR